MGATPSRPVSGAPATSSIPIWARLLAVPVVIAITLFGLWVTAGQITSDFALSMVLSGLWFGLAFLIAIAIGFRWRQLALPVVGTFMVTAGVVTVVLFASTFIDSTVDETIAVASPAGVSGDGGGGGGEGGDAGNTLLATGEIVGQAHGAGGEASIVELPDGGSVLTLADLETDNGPDLRVYLVNGTVEEGSINGDFVDLDGLKGNIGNQQYEIPSDIDPATYSTLSIWCRAFSVSFAMADLQPA